MLGMMSTHRAATLRLCRRALAFHISGADAVFPRGQPCIRSLCLLDLCGSRGVERSCCSYFATRLSGCYSSGGASPGAASSDMSVCETSLRLALASQFLQGLGQKGCAQHVDLRLMHTLRQKQKEIKTLDSGAVKPRASTNKEALEACCGGLCLKFAGSRKLCQLSTELQG